MTEAHVTGIVVVGLVVIVLLAAAAIRMATSKSSFVLRGHMINSRSGLEVTEIWLENVPTDHALNTLTFLIDALLCDGNIGKGLNGVIPQAKQGSSRAPSKAPRDQHREADD